MSMIDERVSLQRTTRSVPTPLDGLHETVLAVAGELTGPSSGKAGVSGDAGAEATAA